MQRLTMEPDTSRVDRVDTLQSRLQILRGSRLFSGLPPDVLETLALSMKRRQVAPAETIFFHMDEASALFGIMAGQVRITMSSIEGRVHVLRVLGPGEIFGEITALDGRPRSADAVAVTSCRLLMLERRSLLSLIESQPNLAIGLIGMLCERLRDTTTQVEGLVFHTLSERLASVLLGNDKASNSIDVTQTELGCLTGVSRESVNKTLRAWQADGLVTLQPGRVRIEDANRLKKLLPPVCP